MLTVFKIAMIFGDSFYRLTAHMIVHDKWLTMMRRLIGASLFIAI